MTLRNLPPLAPLIGFCTAAKHQSFTRAAQELNLTHGAISRAVKQLEDYYGAALFQRRNRRVFLTDKGRYLAEHASVMLTQLQGLNERMRQPEGASLAVSCEPSLAMRWLMPRLSGFYQQSQVADVHLSTAGGPVDMVAQGLDLAIRRSDFKWPQDYWVSPLGRESIGLVCHPDYWLRHRDGATTLLHSRTRPHAWEDWQALAGQPLLAESERYFDHFYFSLQAAVAGLGLAVGPRSLVVDDMERGHLIAPFGFVETRVEYVALSLTDPARSGGVQQFIDWLAQELKGAL
ncbi:LysR substrate-binding domain-containing protein [Ferrimonas kyonanensis]|uniref:LysR substrate-binding domain-containing protein n=1 Tax=Ferrimonas kyonanensis TaxID=364763 RepID=UPI000416E4F3|nr:LysR substrate-binding domain-containing protein [Ferrimonas kyonanensis]